MKRIIIGEGKYKCALVDGRECKQLIIRRKGRGEDRRVGFLHQTTIEKPKRGDIVLEFHNRTTAQMFGVLMMNLIHRMTDEEFGKQKNKG